MNIRKIFSAVAISVTSLLGITLATASAQAAFPGCISGYACLWQHNNYGGLSYGKQYDGQVVSTMNNKASSAAANGRLCEYTYFYDHGAAATGSYFRLNSQQYGKGYYNDGNLSNGAGIWADHDQNWNDRVSRTRFMGEGCV